MSKKPEPSSQDSATLSRRRVFAGVGGAGALAAVAVVLPSIKVEQPAPVVSSAPTTTDGGYQLTEHVKRYYETARV